MCLITCALVFSQMETCYLERARDELYCKYITYVLEFEGGPMWLRPRKRTRDYMSVLLGIHNSRMDNVEMDFQVYVFKDLIEPLLLLVSFEIFKLHHSIYFFVFFLHQIINMNREILVPVSHPSSSFTFPSYQNKLYGELLGISSEMRIETSQTMGKPVSFMDQTK